MKKESILKMIDTFIRDLKEIRADVEKFEVSENTESYTQYTDDELASFIAKTLEGRKNGLEILDKAADLSNTPRIQREVKSVRVDTITFKALSSMLDETGVEYLVKPRKDLEGGKSIVFKNTKGKELAEIEFSTLGYVRKMSLNSVLNTI